MKERGEKRTNERIRRCSQRQKSTRHIQIWIFLFLPLFSLSQTRETNVLNKTVGNRIWYLFSICLITPQAFAYTHLPSVFRSRRLETNVYKSWTKKNIHLVQVDREMDPSDFSTTDERVQRICEPMKNNNNRRSLISDDHLRNGYEARGRER